MFERLIVRAKMDHLEEIESRGGEESLDRTVREPDALAEDFDSVSTSPTAPSSCDGDGNEISENPRPCPLQRAVEAAGLYASAFGVSSIEIWVLCRRSARLERPDGGAWLDSYASEHVIEALDVGVAPPAVPPGVGLPGALWSETGAVTIPSPAAVREWAAMDDEELAEDLRRAAAGDVSPDGWNNVPFFSWEEEGSKAGRGGGAGSRREMLKGLGRSIGHSLRHSLTGDRCVLWRQLRPMIRDPDRPDDARLKLYVESGFALASGVRFEVGGHRGVLIFLALKSANVRSLRSEECEAYLRHASGVISVKYAQSIGLS